MLHSKICAKYRKQWKSYVSFQLFVQTRAFLAEQNISSILLQYPTFVSGFLKFSLLKQQQN